MSLTFESIKYQIATIQFRYLEMNEEKTAIEANPSSHRIAQYVEGLLKEKDGEIETLKAENSKMRRALEGLTDENNKLAAENHVQSEEIGELRNIIEGLKNT